MNKKYLPLTDVQKSYLYGRNKNLFLGGISTHFYIEYRTKLDIKRLEKALNCVIAEQPSLRSYITSEAMQCFMDKTPYYTIEEEDISHLNHELQKKIILEQRNIRSSRIFELDKWPMFEFKTCNLGNGERMLFIDADMMIMDGMSTELLLEGLHRCYNSPDDIDIIPFEVIEKHIKYTEFSRNEHRNSDEEFWKQIIPKLPSGPQFSKIQNIKSYKFARSERIIAKEKWDKIRNILSKKHILPSVYIVAAYAKVLARWCSQKKITLNFTISNRKGSDKEILKTMGDFTEVMLLDFDLENTCSCIDIAAAAQKKISTYKKHRAFESSAVIHEYSIQNNTGDMFPFPAVSTSMMFDKAGSIWEWLGERTYQISQTPQVILDNQVSLKEGKLCIHWDYVNDCFSSNEINNMQDEYIAVLLENEDDIQKKYDIVAKEYNNSSSDIAEIDIVSLFKHSVEKFSNKKAVADEYGEIDYATLDSMSDKIARYTIDNIGAYQPVILKMSRHINAVAAMLGILKSGGYYIPVAEDIPEKRLEFIIKQSGSNVIYDDVKINEILESSVVSESVNLASHDKTAYVIYTSGSTGSPKGVVIKHDAVCNTLQDINCRFGITENDSAVGISFFGFDLSVYDIFGMLSCGGTLYLARSAQDIYGIRKIVTEKEVTLWNTVPSIMELFINNLPDDYISKSLHTVMLSGDWISLGLPEKIYKHFPNAVVYSLGGATEASIWSIYYPVKSVAPEWKSIPYGYPLANQTIWILDDSGKICPEGVIGEICIGGRGIASGYLNDAERTDKQFIKHEKLGNIYMTGDLGYLSEDKYVVFMGRKDFQVKLNGYRIELGEIENCLLRCNNVREAVAEVKDIDGKKKLCAYVTAEKCGSTEIRKNADILKKNLSAVPCMSQKRYEEIQSVMDEYSLGIMFKLFSDITDKKAFSIDFLISAGKILERYRKIAVQWADSLVKKGYLTNNKDGNYLFSVDNVPEIVINDIKGIEKWNQIFEFLAECSEKLESVVSGRLNPMSILFKDGKADIAESLYGTNPAAEYCNTLAADYIQHFVKNFNDSRKLKVLEVGAGVGATTEPIIRKLSGYDISYEFTDISEFFIDISKERLSFDERIKYGILDINEEPYHQGYNAGQFDIIIAANVLHDGKNIRNSLENLRTLLNKDGMLLLLEVTENRHFHKISMGLMNGYSDYEDEIRIKHNSPLLSVDEWKDELACAGFIDIYELTSDVGFQGGQSVITALSGKEVIYPDIDEMYEILNESIVKYMIPENIIIMDSFPYTSNGKINRKKLPVYSPEENEISQEYEPPETETEKIIADILCKVANIDCVSVTSDFAHIGIDSLKGITFITKLQENGIKISLSELYEYSNVRKISNYVDKCNESEELLECGEI